MWKEGVTLLESEDRVRNPVVRDTGCWDQPSPAPVQCGLGQVIQPLCFLICKAEW